MLFPILATLALLAAGIFAIVIASQGRNPATLFFVAAIAMVTASAALDLAIATGAGGLGDWRQYLDWLALRIAGAAIALGALTGIAFSLPPRLSLVISAAGLVAIIALASGHVPTLGLPIAYIVAAVLLFSVLTGWRNRRAAASWLLGGLVAAALADICRNAGLAYGPFTTNILINLALAPALLCFGASARQLK